MIDRILSVPLVKWLHAVSARSWKRLNWPKEWHPSKSDVMGTRQKWCELMKRSELRELYYITPIENLQSILRYGLLSHRRSPSRISDITAGLEHLEAHFRGWSIQSLAVPALGCENGGLEWDTIRELLNSHLQQLDIDFVEIYAPYKPPTPPPGQSERELGFPDGT